MLINNILVFTGILMSSWEAVADWWPLLYSPDATCHLLHTTWWRHLEWSSGMKNISLYALRILRCFDLACQALKCKFHGTGYPLNTCPPNTDSSFIWLTNPHYIIRCCRCSPWLKNMHFFKESWAILCCNIYMLKSLPRKALWTVVFIASVILNSHDDFNLNLQ